MLQTYFCILEAQNWNQPIFVNAYNFLSVFTEVWVILAMLRRE